VAIGRAALDIADPVAVEQFMLRERPQLIINAAAFTNVDEAEHDRRADLVNRLGPAHLADAALRAGALLVQVSTDYVFDGRADEPYAVDAVARPISAYGRTKLAGEEAVRASGCDSLIVRTSWLFAPWGRNFVLNMLTAARQGKPLRVVDDQFGRPTYAPDLARMIFALVDLDARGIFHLANEGVCSWFEFAGAIFDLADEHVLLDACTTTAFPRPAARPRYSVLDLSLSAALIGQARHWSEALSECLAALRADEGLSSGRMNA